MAYLFDSEGALMYSLQQPSPAEHGQFGRDVTFLGAQPIVATNTTGADGAVFVFDSDGQSFLTLEYPGSDSTNSGFGYPVAASVDLDLIVVVRRMRTTTRSLLRRAPRICFVRQQAST